MAELNHNHLALRMGKFHNLPQWFDLLIFPNANIFGGNSSFRSNRRSFNGSQTWSTLDNSSHMCPNEELEDGRKKNSGYLLPMPHGVLAIFCRILTKRREHDSILHFHASNFERLKELWDWIPRRLRIK